MLVTSTIISIIIQILTAGIDVWGLTIPLPDNYSIYHDLLKIELGVQTVELIFYIWLATKIKSLSNITIYRYVDWFITTPTMLFTLIVFLHHNGEKLTLTEFIKNHKDNIIIIIGLNVLMLVFGLLGELGILGITTSVTLGFIPFAYYFWYIYKKYVVPDTQSQNPGIISRTTKNIMFIYFLIFWSLYGICAYFPYEKKNTGYNILDLFAKNGFGIVIVYLIWYINKKK